MDVRVQVGITTDGEAFVSFTSAYDARVIATIKHYAAHSSERTWDARSKRWLVWSSDTAGLIATALEEMGYSIIWTRLSPVPEKAPESWAVGMFASLPAHTHRAVYRALARVLHPDAGGDAEAMKTLNQARDVVLEKAA